jgi:hypothetical protein
MNEVTLQVYEPDDKVIIESLVEAMQKEATTFSISSEFALAVDVPKAEVVEKITKFFIEKKCGVTSVSPAHVIIKATGDKQHIFATLKFFQRNKYCSIYAKFWTSDEEVKTGFETAVKSVFKDRLAQGTICGVKWAYINANGLNTTYIEELLTDTVYDEAYPSIQAKYGTLLNFVESFLKSDESILVLQGPPGTGKSRLIRFIMATLARSKTQVDTMYNGESPRTEAGFAPSLVLYTSDTKALQSDELFARFITSDEPLFIIEDADHLLKPRAEGNDDLHRFLSVSDGIIKNIGRKIIFTTNLPNVGDLDDALIRAGRCYDRMTLGNLTGDQAISFAEKLSGGKGIEVIKATTSAKGEYTIADIYKAWNKWKNQSK